MLTLLLTSCRMPPHPFCLVYEHLVHTCGSHISALEARRWCIAKRSPKNGCLCHVAIGYSLLDIFMIMESLKSTGVETQWAFRLISLTCLNVLPIFPRMDSSLEWQAYLKNILQAFKVWKKD